MIGINCITLNAKQAAHYIGISYWTLLSLVREGRIKHFKAGSRILFRQQSLDEWITNSEEESIKQAT